MISKIIFGKTLPKPVSPSAGEPFARQPYIVSPAESAARSALHRRASIASRQPVIHIRAQRGLRLVSPPRAGRRARTAKKLLWSGWLNQTCLDRGFLFLAASSAVLLLLSSR